MLVDTGFNGELLLSWRGVRELGLAADFEFDESEIELGDGGKGSVLETRTTITWLDRRQLVRVLVSPHWLPGADAPSGLIGTGLLTPHLLLLDFGARTVEIEIQD